MKNIENLILLILVLIVVWLLFGPTISSICLIILFILWILAPNIGNYNTNSMSTSPGSLLIIFILIILIIFSCWMLFKPNLNFEGYSNINNLIIPIRKRFSNQNWLNPIKTYVDDQEIIQNQRNEYVPVNIQPNLSEIIDDNEKIWNNFYNNCILDPNFNKQNYPLERNETGLMNDGNLLNGDFCHKIKCPGTNPFDEMDSCWKCSESENNNNQMGIGNAFNCNQI